MKVNIGLLDIGKLKEIEFSRKYEINKIPFKIENLNFKNYFNINFVVKKISELYMVNGNYSTIYSLICDKCGEQFNMSVDKNFEFFMTKNADENDDKSIIEIGNADILDLSEYIREEIILGLPVTLRCSDTCKGMCHACGKNLNKKSCDCNKNISNNIFGNIDVDKLGLE